MGVRVLGAEGVWLMGLLFPLLEQSSRRCVCHSHTMSHCHPPRQFSRSCNSVGDSAAGRPMGGGEFFTGTLSARGNCRNIFLRMCIQRYTQIYSEKEPHKPNTCSPPVQGTANQVQNKAAQHFRAFTHPRDERCTDKY